MRNLFTFILFVASLFVATFNYAQDIIGASPGYPPNNPIDCNTHGIGGTNFQDNGGGGNYTPNFYDSIVFCPDLSLGTKTTVTFAVNAGFIFNVHASDTIYIYDGPSTNSPLIGAINSSTHPTGIGFQASWDNPSGCLTVVFRTDGANEGAGWLANVQCGNPNQPFEMHMEAFINGQGANALNPIDTGFVDICFGDSVLFVATPLFPYSAENNNNQGYSQNVNNVAYEWEITDGGTYPSNDSIWFKPQTRNGFLVQLKITDGFPQSARLDSKVRVSQIPDFSTTGSEREVICLGESTNLLGGVTASDTVGVEIPQGTFNLGGNHAGILQLPDGSGQVYSTGIDITGFPMGSTMSDNPQDLNQICLTMEHSFTGDLEIWLECPPVAPATTGTIVPLLNSYNPGTIPGGSSGGSIFLGHPYDDYGGGPAGIGWEYCFSSVFNTIGSMSNNWGNTVPVTASASPQLSGGNSMDPSDIYAPESSFADFEGCPVNGEWTIHVRDNIGIDDGWIFEWGLYFDAAFLPGLSNYQNTVDNSWWDPHPTIVSGQNDTSIVVLPTTIGDHSYTFNITDDFGCDYDTTVVISVRPLPEIFNDTIGCDMQFQVSGTQTFNGGVWSSPNPNISFSNTNNANPLITTSLAGTYTVHFLDNTCQYPQTAEIIFPQYPQVFADTTICNLEFQVDTSQIDIYGTGTWSYFQGGPIVEFSPNSSQDATTFTFPSSGSFILTLRDDVCQNTDNVTILVYEQPQVYAPEFGCELNTNALYATSFDGGVWSGTDPNGNPIHDSLFLNGILNNNQHLAVLEPGTYTISYTDNQCNITETVQINFPPYIYTDINDTLICAGIEYTLGAFTPPAPVDFIWNTGATGNQIVVSQPGMYIVTASNSCHSYTDTAYVDYRLCDIEAPNVISLSSLSGNNLWFVQSAGIADFECVIVNRWGNLIYEFNDVNGSWNGRDKGGNVVSEGVYFYTIKAKVFGGDELVKQGFIQVVH